MGTESLITDFFNKYTSKEETLSKLPLSMTIDEIWADELNYRKERANVLPLTDASGENYWFVQNSRIIKAGDKLAELARNEAASSIIADSDRIDPATLIDEAYYSSATEGAAVKLERARSFLASGMGYKTRDEQMLKGTYNALKYAAEHLRDTIDSDMMFELARLLNQDANGGGYRTLEMNIRNASGDVVFATPSPASIKPMMDNLFKYIADPRIHPIIKSAIAHMYFVAVQPFADGNGRLGRFICVVGFGLYFDVRILFDNGS